MDKCLIIGSTVCDVVINVEQLPTTAEDVHITSQEMALGGCAYNVVSVLHHLDVPYTFNTESLSDYRLKNYLSVK